VDDHNFSYITKIEKKKTPTLEISREKASNVSHPQRVN
jgi:hypothetical protein